VFLIDLGSSHGTFLDGSQLPPNKPVVLKNGSSIKFGQGPAKFVMRDVESAGAQTFWLCVQGRLSSLTNILLHST
jgi:pSer/pThr/pTyr-binding forkhead associated (FHA) protein